MFSLRKQQVTEQQKPLFMQEIVGFCSLSVEKLQTVNGQRVCHLALLSVDRVGYLYCTWMPLCGPGINLGFYIYCWKCTIFYLQVSWFGSLLKGTHRQYICETSLLKVIFTIQIWSIKYTLVATKRHTQKNNLDIYQTILKAVSWKRFHLKGHWIGKKETSTHFCVFFHDVQRVNHWLFLRGNE